jgi:archaemetzincin
MKELIFAVVVLGLIYLGTEKIREEKNKNLFFTKETFERRKAQVMGNSNDKETTPKHTETSTVSFDKETVYVRALGDVDSGDLDYAANVIQNFFGYNVIFLPSISITESMIENGYMESTNALVSIKEDRKVINIVDRELYQDGKLLRGIASGDEKTIIVRGEKSFMNETIVHEIGHTFGLDHCSDLTCVMALNNDDFDSGDFCNECKRKMNK